jgi:hypothetical protein
MSGFCEQSNVTLSVKFNFVPNIKITRNTHSMEFIFGQCTTLILQCIIIFTACFPGVEQTGVMFTMFKGKMYFLNSLIKLVFT